MPPSAGACHTTDASLNPDCGRAADRSSIITAIGWSLALDGETSTPSSGAATSTGVATGVGLGEALSDGDSDGSSDVPGAVDGTITIAEPDGLELGPAPGPKSALVAI